VPETALDRRRSRVHTAGIEDHSRDLAALERA
jgi:hypothetical protein